MTESIDMQIKETTAAASEVSKETTPETSIMINL
jgi:hypothetical protein